MRKNDFSGLEEEEILHLAKKQCLNLLKQSDKTEMQLRRKLKEGGFPPFAVDGAIAYAASFHYIDDERYARNYLEMGGQKKSRKRMEMELLQKGIDREQIRRCLDEVENNEEEAAFSLLKKRAAGKDWTDERVQRRLFQYLAGQGFSYEIIRNCVRRYEQMLEEMQ